MSCAKYPTGYPITAIVTARKLRAAGETLAEIAEFIGQQYGTQPSTNTISVWTNKKAAKTRHKYNRSRQRNRAAGGGITGARLGRKEHSSEFRMARMRALRAAGLKDPQVARVMQFDYGDPMTAHMVFHAFVTGVYPRSLR
jgi:hypothetical protein